MKIYEEAGLPPGVINLVLGSGREIGEPVLAHPDLAGIHFTGSTAVFHGMWKTVGGNMTATARYPRLVGETGGKDFIVAHPPPIRRPSSRHRARRLRVPGAEVLGGIARLRARETLWPEMRERWPSRCARSRWATCATSGTSWAP